MQALKQQIEILITNSNRLLEIAEVYFRPPDPAETALPKNIDIKWSCHELHIHRTTFYQFINNRLLYAVDRIGNSDYFDREEVIRLYQRHLKERLSYKHMQPQEGLKKVA